MSKIEVRINPDVQPTGSDLAVCNAARRSFNTRSDWDWSCIRGCQGPNIPCSKECHKVNKDKGNFKLKDKDKRLIEFLARGMTADDFEKFKLDVGSKGTGWLYYMDNNKEQELVDLLWQWRNTPTHESPFGHCFFSFEVKLPLFLARQLVKHKFLRWSEYSRRYITDDVEFYEHDYRQAAESKKQGSGGPHKNSSDWKVKVSTYNQSQLKLYNDMIRDGIAPEQARGVLPADLMTAVTWSGSLDAFASMCRLRLGSDAQYEAQIVAKEVYKYLKEYCPISAKSLVYGVR